MPAFDVFLSHNSVDKAWVSQLKEDLRRYGLKVWLDKDEISPGDLFAKALEQGLEDSKAVALIVSPAAMASGWVEKEYYRPPDPATRHNSSHAFHTTGYLTSIRNNCPGPSCPGQPRRHQRGRQPDRRKHRHQWWLAGKPTFNTATG